MTADQLFATAGIDYKPQFETTAVAVNEFVEDGIGIAIADQALLAKFQLAVWASPRKSLAVLYSLLLMTLDSSTVQRFLQTAVNSSFNVICAGLHRPVQLSVKRNDAAER